MSQPELIIIQSYTFRNMFLRLDGSDVDDVYGSIGASLTGRNLAGSWETFKLHFNGDHTYSLESNAFPGIFVRLDGRNVTSAQAHGGGVVNCCRGAEEWEKFYMDRHDDGAVSFRSAAFSNVYLRMDGRAGHLQDGQVNAQFTVDQYEKFLVWRRM
ncbi:hypothetical protein BYT27DRAFT_7131541 [Phlegmacium glaucopus]|nr:hypothetical protein BYT27DRAFT_7131541 [Phlegmacium glaucopus]